MFTLYWNICLWTCYISADVNEVDLKIRPDFLREISNNLSAFSFVTIQLINLKIALNISMTDIILIQVVWCKSINFIQTIAYTSHLTVFSLYSLFFTW